MDHFGFLNLFCSITTAVVLAVMYSLTNYQPLDDDFFRYGNIDLVLYFINPIAIFFCIFCWLGFPV